MLCLPPLDLASSESDLSSNYHNQNIEHACRFIVAVCTHSFSDDQCALFRCLHYIVCHPCKFGKKVVLMAFDSVSAHGSLTKKQWASVKRGLEDHKRVDKRKICDQLAPQRCVKARWQ